MSSSSTRSDTRESPTRPTAEEAVRRVRDGEAAVAYLLRPTRIEDVFAYARRGEVLPPKTTYFFPKLVTGLLFLRALRPLARALPRCGRGHPRRPGRAAHARRTRARARQGEGGDDTTAIDAAAETAVVHRLRRSIWTSRSSRRSWGSGSSAPARPGRRSRPDRRLDQREARHPLLRALGRDRGWRRRWATSCSATSTTSARARSGRPSEAGARF